MCTLVLMDAQESYGTRKCKSPTYQRLRFLLCEEISTVADNFPSKQRSNLNFK